MPGVINYGVSNGYEIMNESNGNSTPIEGNSIFQSPFNSQSPYSEALDVLIEDGINTSIDRLYDNVFDMQSSDQSPSRVSFGSDGDESRIDSELCHLVGGEMREVEIMLEDIHKLDEDSRSSDIVSMKENGSCVKKPEKARFVSANSVSPQQSKGCPRFPLNSTQSTKSGSRSKNSHGRPLTDRHSAKSLRRPHAGVSSKKQRNSALGVMKVRHGVDDQSEESLGNPDLGPFLLKKARDVISCGDNPQKALEFALRSVKSFEKRANGNPCLELVTSLHIVAAIYCNLGQYNEAIPILERSIELPVMEEKQDHVLAKFSGYMQLGDTYAMLGQLDNSISCYKMGLDVQKQILGDMDPRVGETCRYLAEAHVQALQFDDAEKLCRIALDIHKENRPQDSLKEAADRRLLGLICGTKGDHEMALEHLVLASMAMVANGQETEVAIVDCSIGDTYLSLAQYDEAVFAYQKALTSLKKTKGEHHPSVASIFVRLADLYNKTGKFRESKSYCENALRIYGRPIPRVRQEEIASGLTDVAAIYESINEPEQALKLLKKAFKIYTDSPGQQSTIAGIEAQMGIMYYIVGNYSDSYTSFKNAISKLQTSGEKKSAFLGITLNQMGLACVQRYAINEAAGFFEEAQNILEQECGPYHPDTLGVYSNLAATYDAMGRLDDAIEILEYVVGMREEKIGTANSDIDDEKRRLGELLKEAGRVPNRKARSLENLLDTNSNTIPKSAIKV